MERRGLRGFVRLLVPSRTFLHRAGFAGTALVALATASVRWQALDGNPWFPVAAAGLGLLGVVNLLPLVRPDLEQPLRHLGFATLLYSLLLTYLHFTRYAYAAYATDSMVMSHVGAQVILTGGNPYGRGIAESFDLFNLPLRFVTFRMDGSITNWITYPALNFLLFVPFVALGLRDLRLVLLGFHILALAILYIASPRDLRLTLLFPLFLLPGVPESSAGSTTDAVWVVPMMVLVLRWDQGGMTRGVAYGIASSFKQLPWLVAPYLLLRIWNEAEGDSWKRLAAVLRFSGIAGGTFLALNLPFIVWDPGGWLRANLDPVASLGSPMVVFGTYSLSSFTQYGFWTLTKGFYTVAVVSTTLALALIYHLEFQRLWRWLWMFPVLIVFVDYRALFNHWTFWAFPGMAEAALAFGSRARNRGAHGAPAKAHPGKPWVPVVTAGIVAVVLVGSAVFYGPYSLPTRPHIDGLGMADSGGIGAVDTLVMNITNPGANPISPRLGVAWGGWPIYYWGRAVGRDPLEPGAIAEYIFSPSKPDYAIPLGESFYIHVNDASSPDSLRVEGPFLAAAPSPLVANGAFRYWSQDPFLAAPIPYHWTGESTGSRGRVDDLQGSPSLGLPAGAPGWLGMRQDLSEPVATLWLNLTLSSGLAEGSAGVVEVRAEGHVLRYALGPPGYQGGGAGVVVRTMTLDGGALQYVALPVWRDWESQGWGKPSRITLALGLDVPVAGALPSGVTYLALTGSPWV